MAIKNFKQKIPNPVRPFTVNYTFMQEGVRRSVCSSWANGLQETPISARFDADWRIVPEDRPGPQLPVARNDIQVQYEADKDGKWVLYKYNELPESDEEDNQEEETLDTAEIETQEIAEIITEIIAEGETEQSVEPEKEQEAEIEAEKEREPEAAKGESQITSPISGNVANNDKHGLTVKDEEAIENVEAVRKFIEQTKRRNRRCKAKRKGSYKDRFGGRG